MADDLNEYLTDDEDLIDYVNHISRPRRPKIIRLRPNHFEIWDDLDFFVRFRLSKDAVVFILDQIRNTICNPTTRNHAVTPENMLLLTLRFYATGSMIIVAGDFIGVHKSTACKIIHKVSRAIASLRASYIRFPNTEEEISKTRQGFYKIAKFPRVIAAIDCTHVKIQSPGGDDAEVFRNRKSFFSINVQTTCDADLKHTSIVARWPGSSHDSTIFSNSILRARFEAGELTQNIIVADSGYAVRPFMVTPLLHPSTPAETLFNESQIRTRNPIERSYGVWKRRFPILALGIRLRIDRVEAIIVATAVLHNIACDMREVMPPVSAEVEAAVNFVNNVPVDAVTTREINSLNNYTRNNLIHGYFQTLLNDAA